MLEIGVIFVRNNVPTFITFAGVCLDYPAAKRLGLHLVHATNDANRRLHLRFRVQAAHRTGRFLAIALVVMHLYRKLLDLDDSIVVRVLPALGLLSNALHTNGDLTLARVAGALLNLLNHFLVIRIVGRLAALIIVVQLGDEEW